MFKKFSLLFYSLLFIQLNSVNAGDEKIRPVKLSHKVHMALENVDCSTCHKDTDISIRSSDIILPSKEVCSSCHDVESPEKCSQCHLTTGRAGFRGFITPEPELNFNHKYHTVTRGLPCFFCHGDIENQDIITEANMPPMTTCFNCHNDKIAPTDCGWCHLNEDNLRPEFHTADWLNKHRVIYNSGKLKAENNCAMCHQDNWCQECHTGSQLTKSSPQSVSPFYQPSERGRKPQTISRVHSLNYRFLHPIDAKGRDMFCTTCHEFTEFCVECHREDENRFMPKWHQGADWAPGFRIGGRHADFARRDLERCMGCHDLQGEATICMRCHLDNR